MSRGAIVRRAIGLNIFKPTQHVQKDKYGKPFVSMQTIYFKNALENSRTLVPLCVR